MRRALVVTAVIVSLVGVGSVADSVGLLSELVPWPMMVSAVPMAEVRLTAAPQEEITGLPVASGLRYGLLSLGNGPDAGVALALATEPTPRCWVDQDSDGDLSDEVEQLPTMQIMRYTYGWYVDVAVKYTIGEATVRVMHRVSLLADRQLGSSGYSLLYGGFCYRSGLLDLNGTPIPVALGTLRNDARYDDLASLLIAVDTDGDGTIDMLPGSVDVYEPGGEFQVGATLYAVTSVSPDGRRVTVQETGTGARRPAIAPGEPAPDFGMTTVSGQSLRLSDLRGRPVVLLLTWWPEGAPCTTCGAAQQEPVRLSLLRDIVARYGDRVAVVVVATNSTPLAASLLQLSPGTIHCAQDHAVGEIYRRVDGLFVLDENGIIVDMDVPWSTMQGGHPVGSLDVLSDAELEDHLSRLLAE